MIMPVNIRLFIAICDFARSHYGVDRVTYHVHASLEDVPSVDELELQLGVPCDSVYRTTIRIPRFCPNIFYRHLSGLQPGSD